MTDTSPKLRSIRAAAVELGADPKLLAVLVRMKRVPVTPIGKALALDNDGFAKLREALREYEASPPARSA